MTDTLAATLNETTSRVATDTRLQRERRFFTGMAIAIAAACFAGFAPSYYLKSQFGTPPLRLWVHIHVLVFTLWIALLVAQTSLIATGRVRLHRQLGIAGGVLAILMFVTAAAVALGRGKTITPGLPHEMVLGFLAISAVALLTFPALIGTALAMRRNAGAHKRLMMLATIVILPAAVHRLLMFLISPTVGPPAFFGVTDLFIVAMVAYDIISRRSIHPATLWGGLAVVLSQAASVILAGSKAWMTFAHWITGT